MQPTKPTKPTQLMKQLQGMKPRSQAARQPGGDDGCVIDVAAMLRFVASVTFDVSLLRCCDARCSLRNQFTISSQAYDNSYLIKLVASVYFNKEERQVRGGSVHLRLGTRHSGYYKVDALCATVRTMFGAAAAAPDMPDVHEWRVEFAAPACSDPRDPRFLKAEVVFRRNAAGDRLEVVSPLSACSLEVSSTKPAKVWFWDTPQAPDGVDPAIFRRFERIRANLDFWLQHAFSKSAAKSA